MESIEARILLKNLLKRVKTQDDGSKQLGGVLTEDELDALRLALDLLMSPLPVSSSGASPAPVQPLAHPGSGPMPCEAISSIPASGSATLQKSNEPASADSTKGNGSRPSIELDLGALILQVLPKNVRLCLDFGTAMSKATLVEDSDDAEEIRVLELGRPGDQEEVSEVMLISSVYIDNAGMLWFGKAAVDRSMVEGSDGSRLRLDNIKRRLSEEGWDEPVTDKFNPTKIAITQGDIVLAYLTFLTWAVNGCMEDLGYPRNLPRRFAMPCLSGEKGRETVHRLKKLVGESQILADTFRATLKQGIPLEDFRAAVHALRATPRKYPFVAEDVTEPLGVAGSIMSWKSPVDMLIMVADVGAGTSDLSLFRIHVDPAQGLNTASEIEGASRCIPEAGNHLDRMLIELIIKKSGLTSTDQMWVNERSALELQIRDLKESLFNQGDVTVPMMTRDAVDVELQEFLQLAPVRQFGDSLRTTMVEILESVDASIVNWVLTDPKRRLVIALTGGGSELPMVKELAEGPIMVNGILVPVARALPFPPWLRELDQNLEVDYPRIAVSLGGARKHLIDRGRAIHITAGDGTGKATLDGYYVRGN